MAIPSTRAELKEYALRKLGKPVIEINIDDDQMEDRIDEALKYYQDYHFDGTERTWLKHQVTADDKTNEYITITDSNTIGIVNIFDIGDGQRGLCDVGGDHNAAITLGLEDLVLIGCSQATKQGQNIRMPK